LGSKKIVVIILVGLLMTTIFSLGSSIAQPTDEKNTDELASQIENKENVEWVLMFYLNGDNAISSSINICLNLIGAVGATDEVKIAVLADKNQVNDTKLYYFEGTTTVQQDWPLESDMSDPETLVQFCKKVMNDFPSNHYCLEITANKGSGWQGINYDDHSDGIMMTMPELYDAFDEITDNGCMKFDALLIQTCLGGNLEFRYQLNQFCEYYISYADCGLVGDIPFDQILSALVAQPSMDAREFAITTVDLFTPQQYQRIYQAFGATESAQLLTLADAIDDLAVWFIEHLDAIKDDIQSALSETRIYGLQFNIDYYVDLKDFLECLTIDNSDYLDIKNMVLDNIEESVIAKVTLEGYPSCGFNLYFPNKKDDYNNALRYDHALPSPYEETLFALDTNWDEFLKIFLDILDIRKVTTFVSMLIGVMIQMR
jgi:FlaG/FlaF family flagellin (archaellin)